MGVRHRGEGEPLPDIGGDGASLHRREQIGGGLLELGAGRGVREQARPREKEALLGECRERHGRDGARRLAEADAGLAGEHEVDDAIRQRVHREALLLADGAGRLVFHLLGDGEVSGHVLHADDEVRLARDRDPVGEPARLAPHRLDDEVALRGHRVGAEVQ